MADLAKLVVRLEAESSKLTSELQSANRKISQFGKNTESAVGLAKKAIAGLFTIEVVRKLSEMAQGVIDVGDQLNKFSQKVGVSVEKLSALQYSAELSDVSAQQLQVGLVKLNRSLGTTGDASKKTNEILAVFGITSTDTADVVVQLADRFSKMQDSAVKTAAAVQLFGKSGADLIPFLNSGAEAIRAQEEELRKLGALMGKDAAQASEKLNDNMTRLGTAFTGLKLQIAGAALPAVNDLVEGFVKWLSEGDRIVDLANRITIAFEAMGIAAKIAAGFIAGGLVAGPPGAVAGATAMGANELMNRMGVKPNTSTLGPDPAAMQRMQDRLKYGAAGPSISGAIQRNAATSGADSASQAAAASADIYTDKLKNLGLASAAAAKAERDRAAALKAALAAQEQARQRIADYVAGLQEEVDTMGMSRAQITTYQLAKMGASAETQKFAASLAAQIEQVKAATEAEQKWQDVRAQLSAQIQEISDSLQSEEDSIRSSYAKRMQIVEQALEAQLISEGRAVDLINGLWEKQYAELGQLAEKSKNVLTKFAEEAAANIQNAMADTFFNWMQGQFGNLGDQFKAMLDRMVANALAAKLAESLFGAGYGSTTDKMGGWIGKLLPMAMDIFGGGSGAASATKTAASSIDRSGLNDAIAASLFPRANGGPVFPGSAYLVGENGPELFSPSSSGSIIPNAGGGVSVALYISGITDARGIREASGQLASRAGVAVQRAVQRNT